MYLEPCSAAALLLLLLVLLLLGLLCLQLQHFGTRRQGCYIPREAMHC